MKDLLVLIILALILGAAVTYLYRRKKEAFAAWAVRMPAIAAAPALPVQERAESFQIRPKPAPKSKGQRIISRPLGKPGKIETAEPSKKPKIVK